MSRQLIDRSADLRQLRSDGYEIQVHPSNHLLVHNVPYVTANKTVAYGTLIAPLVLAGENGTGPPSSHVMYFQGEYPHNADGEPLQIQNESNKITLAQGLVADHRFSAKPHDGPDPDFHALVTRYATLLAQYAQRIDQTATPLTGRVFDLDDEPSVFAYRDTASTRAGIMAVSEKLSHVSVAILGLGGTGSYVLDLLAKTPVKQIDLYDGDRFTQHNAFRAPGAASMADVSHVPPRYKVDYFREKYSALHLNIVGHPQYVEVSNAQDLASSDFVFICIDVPAAKRAIVDVLNAAGKPFIDVGMGVALDDGALGGLVRMTLSTPEKREHRNGVSFADVADEYDTNIQIADLNALNAALAVIRWKKHLGFYRGRNPEFSSLYTVEWNRLDNQDYLET